MKRAGRVAFASVAISCGLSVGIAACDPLVVNVFVGQAYDADAQCLHAKAVIDVIEGEAEGTCEGVRCFVDSAGEAFVSTRCEAPPDFEDRTLDPRDRQCKLALEVFAFGKAGACPEAATPDE